MHEQGKIQISCGFLLYFLLSGLFLSSISNATSVGLPKFTYTDEITGSEMPVTISNPVNVVGNKVNIYYYGISSSGSGTSKPMTYYNMYIDNALVASQNGANYNIVSTCSWLSSFFSDSSNNGVCGIYAATLCDGIHTIKVNATSLSDASYVSLTKSVIVNSAYCDKTCPASAAATGCANSTYKYDCIQLACCRANVTSACPAGSVCSSGACTAPDLTPPVTSISIPSECTAPVNVSLFCDDSGSGCAETRYCTTSPSGSCTPGTVYTSKGITLTGGGAMVVRYYSKDAVGNNESVITSAQITVCAEKISETWNITVDTIPPTTTANAQNSTGQYNFGDLNEGPLTIFLDCEDATSGCGKMIYCIERSNACKPASPYVGPIMFGKSGTSYMNFYSVDKAGNYEQMKTVELRLVALLPAPPPQLFCGTFSSLEGFTPIMLSAAVLLFLLIGVVYMIGQVLNDPKLLVWCKVELVQGVISVIFIALFLYLINLFCTIRVGDVASLFGAVQGKADYSLSVYQGAEDYLRYASRIAYASTVTARYYIGSVEIMASYSTWECPIWCFFSVGGTGTQVIDGAGAAYMSAGFGLLLNSSMMAMFSALMHVFFLRYVGSGLFLMLLPIALIARSLPFLRNFGSLLMAVLFSFYVVYPLMLSAFYIVLFDSMAIPSIPDENALAQAFSISGWLTGAQSSTVSVTSSQISTLAGITAQSFMHGVFIPTLCLITATAAAAYAARLMGEELDLSRLTQMV